MSSQQISSGHLKVVLSQGPATDASGSTLTLPALGPVGSSFTTGDQTITITNQGNIPVNEILSTPSDTVGGGAASQALAAEAYLCEASSGTGHLQRAARQRWGAADRRHPDPERE